MGAGAGAGLGPYGPLSAQNTGGRASIRSAAESEQQEEAAAQHRLVRGGSEALQSGLLCN